MGDGMDFSNTAWVKRFLCRSGVGVVLALGGLFAGAAWAQTSSAPVVTAFNSYAHPPFVDEDGGLAADLVAYLNQKLAGAYRFQLETIPRSRLMRLHLADPAVFDGIVLFLHPRFVDDPEQRRFLWTDGLFVDRNLLVFRGPMAPPVRHLNDLAGMRFGASLDARYKGLDELVSSQVITRVDSSSLSDSLKQLVAGRVDFTQTNATALHAMERKPVWAHQFASLPVPGDPEFARHILIGKKNADLAERLSGLVKGMPTDPRWKAIASRYMLPVPSPRLPASTPPLKPLAVAPR